MKLTLIGDAHGKITQLQQRINEHAVSDLIVQLGDMGLGFSGVELPEQSGKFTFIRGNHDDPKKCRAHKNYFGDYGFLAPFNLFYLGGAWSIDWMRRRPGVSWWEDEQLGADELGKAVELYKESKPEVMLSHECPSEAGVVLLSGLIGEYFDAKRDCFKSATAHALQEMFSAHRPKLWVFGHYHIDKTFEIRGTKFRCCAELSPFTVEV